MKAAACVLAALWLCLWGGGCVQAASASTQSEDSVWEMLPQQTRDQLSEQGITDETDWQERLEIRSVFRRLLDHVKEGLTTPLKVLLPLGVALLAVAGLAVFSTRTGPLTEHLAGLTVSTALAVQTVAAIRRVSALLKTMAGLTTALVPVLAGVLAASGRTVTAAGLSGTLLVAADGVTLMAAYWVMPLLSGMTAIGLCGTVWGDRATAALIGTVKRIALWGLTLATTVFSAVLGLKGVLYAGADKVGVQTAQFFLKSVPVAGSALSGSLSAVLATISAVKHTVLVYGIIALSAALLPALIELACWCLCLGLLKSVSRWFSLRIVEQSLGMMQDVFTVLTVLPLLCYGMFLVGLGVVVAV